MANMYTHLKHQVTSELRKSCNEVRICVFDETKFEKILSLGKPYLLLTVLFLIVLAQHFETFMFKSDVDCVSNEIVL